MRLFSHFFFPRVFFFRAHRAACYHCGSDLIWEALVIISPTDEITYRYAIIDEKNQVVKWGKHLNTLTLPKGSNQGPFLVEICDEWTDGSHPAALLDNDSFRNIVLPQRQPLNFNSLSFEENTTRQNAVPVYFRVHDWEVRENQHICVTGNLPQLGNWQASWQQVLRMTRTGPSCWEAVIMVELNSFPIVYKYAIGELERELTLEQGESRIAALPSVETKRKLALIFRYDGFLRRESRWRGAGLAVPVFSLRTKRSIGCGEFADVEEAAKWCNRIGFKILQLLPVSDTSVTMTWRDSYPYSSLCVFALHPMYICLEKLAHSLSDRILDAIKEARARLDLPEVDYEETMKAKLTISRQVFDEVGQHQMQNAEYKQFFSLNKTWLEPYSAFCFLRDLFGTAEHWKWGVFACVMPKDLNRLCSPASEWYSTIQYHRWLQYHLHVQLAKAADASRSLHVVLKGDLPIGVDKRSVDTWMHPKLFRMKTSTGAPPDAFDPAGGQNWGFPTYNWEEMKSDGFSWWQRRLQHMAQ